MTKEGNAIIFVATRHFAIYSSRERILTALIQFGYRVIVVGKADHTTKNLHDLNVETVDVSFDKSGFNIFKDMFFVLRLQRLIASVKPVVVHFFHAKPVIFGGFIRMSINTPDLRMFATITGLGRAFEQSVLKRFAAGLAYKFFLKNYDSVIFQNNDDIQLFLDNDWVDKDSAKLVLGSGVDLSRFRVINGTIRSKIIFVSRLIKQKGVGDFVMLAERLAVRFPGYEFVLGGEYDETDPDTYSMANIINCEKAGYVKYESYVEDMPQLLAQAALFVFPSVYREGVPRVCIEAVASGVPVVAYDVPGTREIVVNRVTGVLVDKGNYEELEGAVCRLLSDELERESLALSGRNFVEKEFDLNNVVAKYLKIYELEGN